MILRPVASAAYTICGCISWPFVYGLYRLQARGADTLPAGGFVLASNHVSNFDPWPLGMPLWPHRQLRFMAKAELFATPLAPLLRVGGAFRVRRGEADLEAIDTAIELCRRGEIVAMFPEGTRQRKGLRKRFESRPRSGAARIALGASVPLVPAAIKGTDQLSRLAKVRVAYGQPVPTDDLREVELREAASEATTRLMRSIYELHEAL